MKNKVLVFLTIISLLLISSCASSPKKEKIINSFCEMYIGEYTMEEASNFTPAQFNILYMIEKTTALKIDSIDGIDYYEGTPLKGMPIIEMQKLLGKEKFAAYWAACIKIAEMQNGGNVEDTLIYFNFKNGDYISVSLADYSIQDMNMTIDHTDPNEKVDIFWWLPISFKL